MHSKRGLKGIINLLTKHLLGISHSHDVRSWSREDGDTIVIQWRHSLQFAGFERAVLKGSHGIDPSFAYTVNEAAVDPARHAINLFVVKKKNLKRIK